MPAGHSCQRKGAMKCFFNFLQNVHDIFYKTVLLFNIRPLHRNISTKHDSWQNDYFLVLYATHFGI